VIERNVMAQAKLIDDLLDVSRIITGKLRLQLRPSALSEVIAAAMNAMRPAAESKKIRMDFRNSLGATRTASSAIPTGCSRSSGTSSRTRSSSLPRAASSPSRSRASTGSSRSRSATPAWA
jgi:hypothetical protein